MLAEHEKAVAEHQLYQDAANKYCAWLRSANDKLVTCSDGQNDKEQVLAKIGKLKVLSLYFTLVYQVVGYMIIIIMVY